MVARRSLIIVVLAAFALVPTALAGNAATRATEVQQLDAGVLAQLNAIRTAHGLVPLRLNAALTGAARGHSAEMLADGYFAHNSFSGAPFWKRLTAYSNTSTNGSWSVGENLLYSSPDVGAAKALQLWMASPEHRANILTARWRAIGISALHADSAPGLYNGQPVTVITTDFGVVH